MFNHLQRSLHDEYAEELCDLLIHRPSEQPFDKLKEALVKRVAMTEKRRPRQLLTGEELGDRKPSQLLRRKPRSNRAPGEDGVPDEMYRFCVETLAPWLYERIMALDSVPPQLIAMIKAYYRQSTARFLICNSISQPFGIRPGVRQGCMLSPILFNYAIDRIVGKALPEGDGVEFAPVYRLTDLDYADVIALLASSFCDLQSMVSEVNEVAKLVDFYINAGKLKVFSCCIPDQEKAPLGIDVGQLEEVDSFQHLGARLLPNGQLKDNIVSRVDTAGCFLKPSKMAVDLSPVCSSRAGI
ncbi:hypothetical protein SprV_1002865400 [Sparganum proliferum]